jgi:Domain of unknown function (DUF5076)
MEDKSRPESKMSDKSEAGKHTPVKNQLAIPPGAAADAKAFELVRAWVAQGDLHVSLQMGGWDDPTAWGVVLADLVRHVARFYQEQKRLNPQATIARVRDAMDAELDGEEVEDEGDLVQ